MGWKIGLPSLKLNNAGVKSNSCGDFRSVAEEALEERKGHDPDIDQEKAALNKYEGFRTAADLMEYSRNHVAELSEAQKAAGKRGIRKDAVVMCATVLKPPAAMMNQLPIEDQNRFMDDAFEIFKDIIGEENVKSRADHHDEQGLHTHVFWEPMTEDGRLCAKEMHSLKFFGRLNREMPARLRERGWDIEDCRMYDAAEEAYNEEKKKTKESGRSSYEFKAQAERDKRELETQVDRLQQQVTEANSRAEAAEQRADAADLRADEAEQRAAAAEAAAEKARSEAEDLKIQRTILDGEVCGLYNERKWLQQEVAAAEEKKAAAEEWMDQIPDWPAYDAEATRAFKLLDDFRKLLQEFFSRLWPWRDRKGEKGILEALEDTRDKIVTSISAMIGFEVREQIEPELQRSRVITRSLDDLTRNAAERVAPQKKLPEKSKDIEIEV